MHSHWIVKRLGVTRCCVTATLRGEAIEPHNDVRFTRNSGQPDVATRAPDRFVIDHDAGTTMPDGTVRKGTTTVDASGASSTAAPPASLAVPVTVVDTGKVLNPRPRNPLNSVGALTMSCRSTATVLLVLALACSSGPRSAGPAGITADELLTGSPLDVAQGASPAVVTSAEVLALSPEMEAFLDAHVNRRGSDSLKLRQLVGSIFDPDTFGLRYDEHTRSAAETFRTRRGNCLSFSMMFVVMARDVGLRAQFQDVDIPPDWSLDNDTLVLNRHVNVRVEIEPSGTLVVDFNVADFRASYDMRTISDTEALVQYANNVGFERMQAGDRASALAFFRKAIISSDMRFSPAWTNLGTLYLRSGHLTWAEAAYLQALQADKANLVAMSNLAHVYERTGDAEGVASYRKRVAAYRWRNPYYRYQLARQAFADGDYDAAIDHLRLAIRRKRNEDRFYQLLGQCYQRKGDQRAARRWLARARDVAASQVLRHPYAGDDDPPDDR